MPTLDMQAHQAVEGPEDAQPLSAGLPVGVGEEVVITRLGELFYITLRFARAYLRSSTHSDRLSPDCMAR